MKRTLTTVISLLAASAITVGAAGITVHAHRQPAEEVFATIMAQSGKNFIYAADLLKGVTVSVDADSELLMPVLDRMLAGTGITYRLKGNNVMLMRAAAAPVARATVSGFVREAATDEPLVGVIVTAADGRTRTATNDMGFYSLTLPAGRQQLTATYPGYDSGVTESFTLNGARAVDISLTPRSEQLGEVEVTASPNRSLAVESPSIGALKVSHTAIVSTPVIFGEADVIKTLQLEPGVSAGVEGMAGMYVHGGNTDENLYMLDNIPLYQVNHLGGLFSAFNVEALRNVDFYKSSFPAEYDGRLSSYMDVVTKDGSMEAHHGSVKLGLTSGAFNIDGPLWKGHTSYSVALRRSWYDLLTIPACAIVNATTKDESNNLGYAFTDLNAKITHRFSKRSRAYISAYYGEDYLSVSQTFDKNKPDTDYDENSHRLRWGNIVASAGWNYVFSPTIFGEVTAAYTRYYSSLSSMQEYGTKENDKVVDFSRDKVVSHNNINDWIFKADFDWRPHPSHRINFGAGYTRHSFLPSRSKRTLVTNGVAAGAEDRVTAYRANDVNVYGGGDWQPFDALRIGYGLHWSLFNIDGSTHQALSPRFSFRWTPAPGWAVKGGYSRTVQYVHQLIQSSISLPTDQWVPIVGAQKPQTADKVAAGVYYSLHSGYTFSVEGYWKWMHNLLEYMDEYYLLPPEVSWNDKLTPGRGTSKGIDFKISKEFGKLTGHIAYSLLWADRQYEGLNKGRKFPARFDNRHKINIMVNWRVNPKWELSASWTGMSGNRFTLPAQCWDDPALAPWHYTMWSQTEVNNYRLPFYHRLDLSARRNTRRGYWTFSLYNAYCNMNTIGVRLDYSDDSITDENGNIYIKPVYQKIKLIPIIPSVSYTWLF